MVTRRVAEHAAGVLVGERLGRDALRLVLRHPPRDRPDRAPVPRASVAATTTAGCLNRDSR